MNQGARLTICLTLSVAPTVGLQLSRAAALRTAFESLRWYGPSRAEGSLTSLRLPQVHHAEKPLRTGAYPKLGGAHRSRFTALARGSKAPVGQSTNEAMEDRWCAYICQGSAIRHFVVTTSRYIARPKFVLFGMGRSASYFRRIPGPCGLGRL